LEALIAFSFFATVLTGAMVLVRPSQSPVPLSEMVLLNDFCQVLELSYHEDVAKFMASNGESVSPRLAGLLHFLEEKTGKTMFLEYGKRSTDCEPAIQAERLFVFPRLSYDQESGSADISYFHRLKVGVCGSSQK